jgi:protein-S-isoprenylcysteine O-methyltransferase Ste14
VAGNEWRGWTALRAAVYGSGFVLLWGWLAVAVRPLDRRLGLSLPAWLVPVGLLLAAGGGALTLACVVVFVRAGRGTPAPFDPPRCFVAVGPYRWVRNPMYLGGLALLLGAALTFRSPSVTLLAALFLAAAHLFVVLYEEPSLERRFGESYTRYRGAVRRWLPKTRPTADAIEERS